MTEKKPMCEDFCVLHDDRERVLEGLVKEVDVVKKEYLKWTVFAWIISGLCAVGLLLMSAAYYDATKGTRVVGETVREKNAEQDTRLTNIETKFVNIDTKLDRNYLAQQQILDSLTWNKRTPK